MLVTSVWNEQSAYFYPAHPLRMPLIFSTGLDSSLLLADVFDVYNLILNAILYKFT